MVILVIKVMLVIQCVGTVPGIAYVDSSNPKNLIFAVISDGFDLLYILKRLFFYSTKLRSNYLKKELKASLSSIHFKSTIISEHSEV